MKKFTILISLLLLLTYINTADEYCESVKGKKADDCKDLKKYDSEGYCCYVKTKTKDGTNEGCTEVSKANYNDIKNYVKSLEKLGESIDADIKKLDCYSVYLTGSLLSLVLFFL